MQGPKADAREMSYHRRLRASASADRYAPSANQRRHQACVRNAPQAHTPQCKRRIFAPCMLADCPQSEAQLVAALPVPLRAHAQRYRRHARPSPLRDLAMIPSGAHKEGRAAWRATRQVRRAPPNNNDGHTQPRRQLGGYKPEGVTRPTAHVGILMVRFKPRATLLSAIAFRALSVTTLRLALHSRSPAGGSTACRWPQLAAERALRTGRRFPWPCRPATCCPSCPSCTSQTKGYRRITHANTA